MPGKRPVIKTHDQSTPHELELQKLRLKYINDTQTDSRLLGEKPWVAYYVSLIETAIGNGRDAPYISKPDPFSWLFDVTNADRELYPLDLSTAKSVKITFEPDLEVFYGDLYI